MKRLAGNWLNQHASWNDFECNDDNNYTDDAYGYFRNLFQECNKHSDRSVFTHVTELTNYTL